MNNEHSQGGSEASSGSDATPPEPVTDFPIVGVGASAGGMEAFIALLRLLPLNTGMAFVLIQHLDRTHPSYLTEALSRATAFPVEEITDGMVVQPDHVYVIPPNADVGILKGALALLPRPTDGRKPHLPIDFFFKALAADRRSQAIAVVLSGTGSDGSEGLRAIKAEDGVTFAQDPESAKFGGMPESAVETGVVDFCLPIPALAQELVRIGQHPFVRAHGAEALASAEHDTELKKVLLLVRSASGVDFSEYKLTSIRRRLARRMALCRLTSLSEYVLRLREDRAEVQALCADILIHVTSFFRDVETFEKLKEHVFPEVLKQKQQGGTFRIWCAGCSSGEEAYSIVISLLEYLEQVNATAVPVQLFGTDISEGAVEIARAGFYSDAATRDVGAERLARFFTRVEGGGYRINKTVRERCAFVKHDLARDPPFSKLDLVTCRNVLIYLGPALQKRVLAAFQFALNQPGFLLLGHAENIVDGTNLFSPVDRESKIFARTAQKSHLRLPPSRATMRLAPEAANLPSRSWTPAEIVKRTESLLLEQYAPPGVIVNDRMEILHFRGRTGPYLEPAPGQPQHDLLKMARKGLMAELRIAISLAKSSKATVRRSAVSVEQDGSTRVCDLVVVPLEPQPGSPEQVFAVLFEEPRLAQPETAGVLGASPPASEPRLPKLEDELAATKEYLQAIIEEHQGTNEELLSANEELVSSNEELQSLNEELETAKEELQSTNEELSTLNEELRVRNTEVDAVNSDLVNILGSVEVPIVIVDGARRIRRFTPKARPILNLLPSDVGRPIDDIKPTLAIENLDQKIADVIDTITLHEEEVQDRNGHWYRLQIRPYTTIDKRIDGAVLSIIDIDALKRALGAAEWSRDYARATVEAVQTPLLVLDHSLRVVSANEAFHETYRLLRSEVEGRHLPELGSGVWDIPELRSSLRRVLEGRESFHRLDVAREIPGLGERSMSLSGRAVSMPDGELRGLLAIEDVTERLRAEKDRARLLEETEIAKASAEDANRTKDMFLATLSHELRTPLTSLLLNAQRLRLGNMADERIRKVGESIERATKTQAKLIDDLLDISRITAGKLSLDLEPASLASVVQAAVETMAPAAERKRLELEVHLDPALPPVWGDPVRLQEVVLNLLTNAIKFTPEQGHIAVTLDSVAGRGRIRVSDSGVGIEAEFLPHVFNRFSQEGRGHARSHGGLGLGLAIARYLVEAHGGTVEAQSPGSGKGATFTVSLPLMTALGEQTVGSQAGRPAELRVESIEGIHILVVEDDQQTRDALTEMLMLAGAEVRSAESGAAALEAFEARRPDVLLCDIAMPTEDGYSVLGRIRALGQEAARVPAVALTALAGEEDLRRAQAAGFQLHIAKPIDIHQLVSALAGLVRPQAPAGGSATRAPGP